MSEKFDFWGPIRPGLNKLDEEKQKYVSALGTFLITFNNFESECNALYRECLQANQLTNFREALSPSSKFISISVLIKWLKALQKDMPDVLLFNLNESNALLNFRNDVAHCTISWTNDATEDGEPIYAHEIIGRKHLKDKWLPMDELIKFTQVAGAYSEAISRDHTRVICKAIGAPFPQM